MLFILELFAKATSWLLRRFYHSAGVTWPGEIILRVHPGIVKTVRKSFKKIIYVVGTNGKTSTAKLMREVLAHDNEVITNESGANLLNGVVGSYFIYKKLGIEKGYIGVFEVDEYSFPTVYKAFPADAVIMLNLVRDQLDRYGEVENIMSRWQELFSNVESKYFVGNASDPAVYTILRAISKKNEVEYFGVPKEFLRKGTHVFGDYSYCPRCENEFYYKGRYVSHIGEWECRHCGYKPKEYFTFDEETVKKYERLPDYVRINAQGVLLLARHMGYSDERFYESLDRFRPAFGRGEKFVYNDINYNLFLGKNPASWTVAYEAVSKEAIPSDIFIFGLNNRVPDGHDVSWIWDIDFKDLSLLKNKKVYAYGDRGYDMAQRLKIEGAEVSNVFETARQLRDHLDNKTEIFKNVTILANYSAMLEVRRELTGRAIL